MTSLTREALSRVLQSLLTAELSSVRKRSPQGAQSSLPGGTWPEDLFLGEAPGTSSPSLGCDSLEILWLAAAVNEMFCLYEAKSEETLTSATTFGAWVELLDRSWNQEGQRITFSTSGSSGTPKRCVHELRNLKAEIEFLAHYFAGTRRILALTPAHHIYGFLFTAMLPTSMAIPVLVAEALSPGQLTQELAAGDLVVSVPPRWEWLARSIPNWPSAVHGVTSTAPCPEETKAALRANGLSSLTEVYGSSETAGVGLRSFPKPRFTLMPQWQWAESHRQPATIRDASGRTLALQDGVDIAPDGTFAVRSRLDGGVQVGGVNVFPAQVETQLRALPGVAAASVRLHAEPGRERLKAFVVPQPGTDPATLRAELERWTATAPTAAKIRDFTFGDKLPANAIGKPADW